MASAFGTGARSLARKARPLCHNLDQALWPESCQAEEEKRRQLEEKEDGAGKAICLLGNVGFEFLGDSALRKAGPYVYRIYLNQSMFNA